MEHNPFEKAQKEAQKTQDRVSLGKVKGYTDTEATQVVESHVLELRSFGLSGLEGRVKHGLDPAGMLAVSETRELIDEIANRVGADMAQVEGLTRALHAGAVWTKAQDLALAEKSEVRVWMLLADECHEVNDGELSAKEYLNDVQRIKQDLTVAERDPEQAVDKAVENIVHKAKEKFIMKDKVPFSEEDAFLHMAIAGEKYGVCKAGDLYFAGADKLDYTVLEDLGLKAVDREDRGRIATFFQKDGNDVVKKLYPGLAIVFGDEALALSLAKSAEKFISEAPEQKEKEIKLTKFRNKAESFLKWLEDMRDYVEVVAKLSSERRGQVHDGNIYRTSDGEIWEIVAGGYSPRSNRELVLKERPQGAVRAEYEDDWSWETLDAYNARSKSYKKTTDEYHHWSGKLPRDNKNVAFLKEIIKQWDKVEECANERVESGYVFSSMNDWEYDWRNLIDSLHLKEGDLKTDDIGLKIALTESINELITGKPNSLGIVH